MAKDTLSIRLSQRLQERLAQLSKQEDRPADDIVRDALDRYFSLTELQRLRDRLRPHAEARGILTDDDIFRIVS